MSQGGGGDGKKKGPMPVLQDTFANAEEEFFLEVKFFWL